MRGLDECVWKMLVKLEKSDDVMTMTVLAYESRNATRKDDVVRGTSLIALLVAALFSALTRKRNKKIVINSPVYRNVC